MRCFQALSSLSIASIASEASRSVKSVLSKSSESVAATQNVPGGGGGNNNAVLVGGVIGGVLGAAALVLVGVLLWKRNRPAPTPPPAAPSSVPSSAQRPFFGQQPSSLPVTPNSQTFSMNSNYTGVPPVTYAPQAAWNSQQTTPVTLPGAAGPPDPRQSGLASQQSSSPPYSVNTWVERPPTMHQPNYGGYASQSQGNLSSPR